MHIKLNLQIFLLMIIFYITKQLNLYVVIMLCTLFHELGHLLIGIILGLKPKSIYIMPLGLTILFENYGQNKELKKILIALAGPITNLGLIIITYIIKIPNYLKEILIYSNILILAFNLLPINILDGGRIIKSILTIKFNSKIACKMINKISNIMVVIITGLASIMILYYKNLAIILIVTYLWIMTIKENQKFKMKERIYNLIDKQI